MGVKISGVFDGGLQTTMTHLLSGRRLETDPPIDNGGAGKSFSPTDLVAAAVGSCMMSVMAIAAKKEKLDLAGMACEVEKHMSLDLPRRIMRVDVVMTLPGTLSTMERARLEEIGNNCPVIKSLSQSVEIQITYE